MIASVQDNGPKLYWGLRPKSEHLSVVTRCLHETFQRGSKMFGYYHGIHPGSERFSIMETDRFELYFSGSQAGNSIDPVSLRGAGDLRPDDGHLPLLMLFYLSDRLAVELPNETVLTFSDEEGREVRWFTFGESEDLFRKFGWDIGLLRTDAERLGLVVPTIDLSHIQTNEQNFFF